MAQLPQLFYDLKGLKCPLPVLKTRKKLGSLPIGSELTIETTDPLSGVDIPHFCHEDGHTLLSQETTKDGYRFHIRKAREGTAGPSNEF